MRTVTPGWTIKPATWTSPTTRYGELVAVHTWPTMVPDTTFPGSCSNSKEALSSSVSWLFPFPSARKRRVYSPRLSPTCNSRCCHCPAWLASRLVETTVRAEESSTATEYSEVEGGVAVSSNQARTKTPLVVMLKFCDNTKAAEFPMSINCWPSCGSGRPPPEFPLMMKPAVPLHAQDVLVPRWNVLLGIAGNSKLPL